MSPTSLCNGDRCPLRSACARFLAAQEDASGSHMFLTNTPYNPDTKSCHALVSVEIAVQDISLVYSNTHAAPTEKHYA